MKYLNYILAIILIVGLTACSDSAKKAPNKAIAAKTSIKKNKPSNFWNDAKKKLKLSDTKVKEIKTINTKYAKQVRALPKSKNGKKDPNQLKSINLRKESDLKRTLGKQYNQFTQLQKTHWKKNKGKGKKGNRNSYWVGLNKTLKLSPAQLKNVQAIDKRYKDLNKKLPKINGKKDKTKSQALNKQKQLELKRALGDKRYAQKLAYDKKMYNNTKKGAKK